MTEAILFDLDDTLYRERQFVDGGFGAVAGFLAARLGQSRSRIRRRLLDLHERDGRGQLFDTLLAESGHPDDGDLVMAMLLTYRTHRPRLTPFAGVVDTLTRLRDAGVSIGLVSDGLGAVQWRKLRALPSIARRLDVVVMTDDFGPGYAKPSPVAFRVACRMLDVAPTSTIYVANDPRKDFIGARAAGLRTIRAGLLPDEGGGRVIATDGTTDADDTAERFGDILPLMSRIRSDGRHIPGLTPP